MTPAVSSAKVVCLAGELAGGYCCRLLGDGGAQVLRIEDPAGDPLRHWSHAGPTDSDGALFQFLAAGSTSMVVTDPAELTETLAAADVIVWSPHSDVARTLTPEVLRAINPRAVVTAITNFGLTGPWVDRPATELTLQAMSGGPGQRGAPERPPLIAGGRLPEWVAGMFAAVHTAAALFGGGAELLDVSILESLILTTTVHPVSWYTIAGRPMRPLRARNLPDVHPTKDGYVGFMVVTGQQWLDFCSLIDRSDWMDDPELGLMANRFVRRHELMDAIDAWSIQHTTAEVLELADLLRVPAANVGTGATIPELEHLVERRAYETNASGGFLQPVVPWQFHGGTTPPRGVAPALGAHGLPSWTAGPSRPKRDKPFTGIRIADFTANWAGPIVGHVLAMLGAEVIHVEGGKRPDAIRSNTCKSMSDPDWPEFSGIFQGTNTGKRSVTVDMSTEDGRSLARRLVATCDVVIENYSPHVMESWGLSWDEVHAINPRAVMVRMPAYGLDGPWRDRGGYAQTMEMASGMAWCTGWPDSTPEIPNGPCDPIAGSHATLALILALEQAKVTGEGIMVEAPMITAALNVAASVVIEQSANGVDCARSGNRSNSVAPQGIYPTSERDRVGLGDCRWIGLSVVDDAGWRAVCGLIDRPRWAEWTQPERRAHHDEIDTAITAWTSKLTVDAVVEMMTECGVPVGEVVLGHLTPELEQLQHRRFFEQVDHPKTGVNTHAGLPARWSSIPGHVQAGPAPMLGEHDDEVWLNQVGLAEDEYRKLREAGVIGRSEIKTLAW
ncbi:CoA transferase [Mycobacterium sp. NBC_00419]|uniref:CaiB/BaiF CoA transferase family protein n=1 Tax=Mycobacterium sp. NBC_00419 TaxID=2975989 RepID=UPI002E1A0BA4